MDYIESDRQKSVNNILAIVKLGALFFGIAIVSIEVLIRKKTLLNIDAERYIAISYVIFVPLMIFVYLLWSRFYVNQSYIKYSSIVKIENSIFMLFFIVLIILSDSYESEFKFLFLFLIISSAIQLGAKFGMATALMSSITILAIDLIY